MLPSYIESFKKILMFYEEHNDKVMHLNDIGIPTKHLDYLSAKGVITVTPYANGDTNCKIKITNFGLIYFKEKKKEQFRFWFPIIITNVISLITLIVATLTYIKQL